jgi:cell wall arabinan synthesis protein/EmbC-like arabinotransferase in arabinogalactan biosynthesis/arabinosyltransferase-like concanavalin domain-containing protein
VFGAAAFLTAVAFPFAPVHAERVNYSWSGQGQAALPLMPYQPASLDATIPCAAASSLPDGVVLSTVPLRTDPTAPVLAGLQVSVSHGVVRLQSAGREIGRRTLPESACMLKVHSTARGTTLLMDDEQVATVEGDVRPAVAGLFTEARDQTDLTVTVTAETMFQTRISALKAALAVLCVLGLLGALLALRTLDRQHGHRVPRLRPGPRWRPTAVDGVVGGVLVLWALIGPVTVDDGYIGGILRSRDDNGFIGNVYRWLNAPEAPFGWFYEIYNGWGHLGGWSTAWLRLPSTLLAVVSWILLSRLLLPRLGSVARLRSTPWLAATAFLAWWLPFNTGLRSEPWVAVGLLAVVCAVERGIATRRVLLLALGLVIATATLATSPTGIVAFVPYLAGLPSLIRLVRARRDLTWLPVSVLALAAVSTGLLLMFADQSLAAVDEATKIRRLAPGWVPWHEEYLRYTNLLTVGSFEGALTRRIPVLLTMAAMAGLALLIWSRRRRAWRLPASGLLPGPAWRLVLTVTLALGLFTLTPTKLTQHFGVLAGVGAGVLVLALRSFRTAGLAAIAEQPVPRLRVHAVGVLVVAALGGLALAGYNQWPFVSNYGVTWGTVAPLVFGQPVAGPIVVTGIAVAAALLVLAAWLASEKSRPALDGPRLPGWVRLVPSPSAIGLAFLVGVVLLQVGTFVKVSVEHRDTYTMANDSVRAVRGVSCGLADYLQAEVDPAGGELQPANPGERAALDGFTPASRERLELAGQILTGWQAGAEARPATARTPWYRLTDAQRRGELPLVVTVSGGAIGPRVTVTAQFDRGGEMISANLGDVPAAPTTRDLRVMVGQLAPGAGRVRLIVTDRGQPTDPPVAFSVPRSPVLTPLTQLLPKDTTVMLDWPIAYHYPCLRMPKLADGTAELPRWRIATPAYDAKSPEITYAPATGGPFSTARMLVTEQQMPLYLRNDPLVDLGRLYRWVPVTGLTQPTLTRTSHTEPGWERGPGVSIPQAALPAR